MPTTLNIMDILSQVKKLDKDEQFNLLVHLVALVRKEDGSKSDRKLSSISGIGSNIWKDIDIDEYVEQERQW